LVGQLFFRRRQVTFLGQRLFRRLNSDRVFQRFFFRYFALRAHDITDLTTYLTNQLCFLQPVLLFLFIKYRADAAVGMVGIAAQVIDIFTSYQ
ncbi:hypothetical protein, partial [Yersinia thracica]|uniref:hypothetical protein n=1 Tax=Yersinia thracica TaxID=2890319 RepID=UPI0016437099